MKYTSDLHVPAAITGTGNRDFHPKLPGHDYRHPGADPIATKKELKDSQMLATQEKMIAEASKIQTLTVPAMIGEDDSRGIQNSDTDS